MWSTVCKLFSRFFLFTTITLIVFLSWGNLTIQPALATITQLEETPGQILYQSRQKLVDQDQHTWQAIAFKRILANGETSFKLRLVGFPGAVELIHPHPLLIQTADGQRFEAKDISDEPFTDSPPAGNVGQYELQSVIFQLPAQLQVGLSLATTGGSQVNLALSPIIVQEWQELAAKKLRP